MTENKLQDSAFRPSLGLAEQIAEHIQKQIVSGELKSGERIAESRVTEELGVSRGPVRESLQVLSRRHLVDLPPRKGARVSDFGPDDVIALYDLQATLMSLLFRRLVETWQPDFLERFNQLLTALTDAAHDEKPLDMLEVSFAFQATACELVNNSYLTVAFSDLQPSFSRAYYLALASGQDEMQSLSGFLSNLIACAMREEVEKGEELIRDFSEHQRELVLKNFEK